MDEGVDEVSYYKDDDVELYQDPSWFTSGSSGKAVTPWGLRSLMSWIKSHYPGVDVYITENGVSDKVNFKINFQFSILLTSFLFQLGNLDDLQRIYYYKHYTNELLKAIKLDGVPVRGYYAWSLLDNFEWSAGFTQKFGLTRVDFNDPQRKRSPKSSFNYFKKLIQRNGFFATDSPC